MSNYPEEFDDLQTLIFGNNNPIVEDSTMIGSWGGDGYSFFSDFVNEQLGSQVVTTMGELGVTQPNQIQQSATEYPYQIGDQSTITNPYHTEYQFEMTRPLPEPMGYYPDNSQHESEASANISPRLRDINESIPKREASATISRRLSDITEEDDLTAQIFATKRKRSQEDERIEPEGSRPKYARKINNENAKYRVQLMRSRPETLLPQGVERLFGNLKSDIIPKKAYYRKKGANATASHPPVPPSASTAVPGTGEEASSNTLNTRSRQANHRRHISVETVRQTAPEGWDRFDNEYYSGDDNVSDGEIEIRGKASDWKPPRMACRRCNKLKQPCDHGYPACSLCAKYGLRCRYRDDLTGRQIKPGQLEEMEVALHDAQSEIKRLREKLKKPEREEEEEEEEEEGQSPRDDAQR